MQMHKKPLNKTESDGFYIILFSNSSAVVFTAKIAYVLILARGNYFYIFLTAADKLRTSSKLKIKDLTEASIVFTCFCSGGVW